MLRPATVIRALPYVIPGLQQARAWLLGLPPERVMLFHSGRSGSTVLGDMMDQHPNMRWKGEVVHRLYEGLGVSRLPLQPHRVLLGGMAGVAARFVGVELQYYQVTQRMGCGLEAFVATARDVGFRHFVVLGRHNVLKQTLSNLVAMARNRWRYASGESVPLTRIRVDVNRLYDHPDSSLLNVLGWHERSRTKIMELLPDSLALTYEEDIQDDPTVGYRRLCRFIDLEPVEVRVTTRRATPFGPADLVENMQDVRDVLAGTAYEGMIDD